MELFEEEAVEQSKTESDARRLKEAEEILEMAKSKGWSNLWSWIGRVTTKALMATRSAEISDSERSFYCGQLAFVNQVNAAVQDANRIWEEALGVKTNDKT